MPDRCAQETCPNWTGDGLLETAARHYADERNILGAEVERLATAHLAAERQVERLTEQLKVEKAHGDAAREPADALRAEVERLTARLESSERGYSQCTELLNTVGFERDELRTENERLELRAQQHSRDLSAMVLEVVAERDALRAAVAKVRALPQTWIRGEAFVHVADVRAALAGTAPTEPKATTPVSDGNPRSRNHD